MAKIRVWNTKARKFHYIHPDLAKDTTFMAQRGMILQPEVKPMAAAPLQATAPVPTFEPELTPAPEVTPAKPSKTKANAN